MNTAISEGVHVTGADAWQAAGFTGKGVKVGIIDGGFRSYTRFLAGANVTARSFRRDGLLSTPNNPDDYHGTACAEIVHEMAPDAQLFLVADEQFFLSANRQEAATQSTALFSDEVDWLISNGVTIISISTGQDIDVPHDGTSEYDQIINRAQARGVFFAVAAGNSGSGDIGSDVVEGHYGAMFADADSDGYHDFDGSNGVTVRIGRDPVTIQLGWDDFQMPHITYGLYLYDSDNVEVARAITPVRTSGLPSQALGGKVPRGTYTVRVRKITPDAPPVHFDLWFDGAQFAQITPAGSLSVPADASGAVAVGQADWQTDVVAPSSSHGPTTDGRTKPDLVAPTCVSSAVYATTENDVFCGTSSAAPHVAGAAALVQQAYPTATPNDLLAFFQTHARPLMGPDADPNTGGAGRLALGPPPK